MEATRSSTPPLRWGVLSTANIGRKAVIPAIQRSRNGQVVAIASRDRERASAVAAAHGVPAAYGSYEALLADPEVDAVYVPLPNNLHHEWTIKAAEAGKQILCEKPLALTAAQGEEMAAAAARHGVLLMEAFMYRFHPQTVRAVELVRNGAVGRVGQIYAVFDYPVADPADIRLQAELGGGSLMDVGCYCVNLARLLAGTEPVEAQAFADWTAGGVDGRMVGTLCFENGLLAQFHSALTMGEREFYHVAGDEGQVEVPSAFIPGRRETVVVERRRGGAETAHRLPAADQYQLMVEHFADCVLHGRPLRYPPADAIANMRAIEALYRSARSSGAVVAVARSQ